MKTINSPKQNVAQTELVFIQKIVTEIKEIIVQDIRAGTSKEETTKKIAKLIAELDKTIRQPQLLKEAKQALALSVQRWYYEHSYNMKVIRTATITNINYSLSRYKGSGLAIRNKGLTVSPQSIYNELMGVETDEQFAAVYEKFRPYIDDAVKGLPVIDDYQKLMKGQIKVLASNPPISNRVDKNGKPYKVNLRNRAEMYVRYQANQEDLQRFVHEGIDLVWISSHADASPRCRQYQGKLYSISGKTGTINGIKYTPLSEALLGPLGDGNGCISGYNCRHRLIEYQTGSKAPNDYTEEEMKRHYQIDQRQRSYENQIRLLKTEERLFRKNGDIETAKRLRQRWRLLNNGYEQYSIKNGRAFYRWRTSIGDEENTVNQDVGTTLQTINNRSKEFAFKPTRINTELYRGVFDNEFKPSNSVVITKERQTHYESRHPEVKGKEKEIIAAIQNPDIILLDDNIKSDGSPRKNSANILKLESSIYLHVSIKFIEEDSGWYNSVMSARIMSEKKVAKYLKNKIGKIVYNKNNI